MKSFFIFIFSLTLAFGTSSPVNETYGVSRSLLSDDYADEIDFVSLVEERGYTAEEYKIKSSDGYNLVLHRISGSSSYPKAPGKKVVYIQHGLFMSSTNFICGVPSRTLAFLLADAGYDVWLGNTRGNVYSRSHESISPDNKTFWDFSFHEMAVYDVKAFIDFVLETTEEKTLVYVGLSLGTTHAFVLLSSLPEYNEKISLVVNLGTIAYWKHNYNVSVLAASWGLKVLEKFYNLLGIHELFPRVKYLGPFGAHVCGSESTLQQVLCRLLCTTLIPKIDFSRADKELLPWLWKTFPAGTSSKAAIHLGQNMRSGELRQYDYGKKLNYVKYGSEEPPKYPLENITAPIAIYYGQNDVFATLEDLRDLRKTLPNVAVFKKMEHEKFNHFDFILGIDTKTLLFDQIIDLIPKYI